MQFQLIKGFKPAPFVQNNLIELIVFKREYEDATLLLSIVGKWHVSRRRYCSERKTKF